MIDTGIVGHALPAHEAVLSVRRMLAYAAAIGDTGAPVFDDAAPGFIAHPALCVALEWPVLAHPASAALVPAQDRLRAVHLVQDSRFHRPLHAGERLVTRGHVAGAWRSRAGTCTACELVTATADGEPAVTSLVVALYRGVEATGPDRPLLATATGAAPALLGAGEPLATLDTDPGLPHRYSECSGIWNPIHTERRVALAAGLPGTVLHGTATWAMAASTLVAHFGGGNPARLRRLRGRFAALVRPGQRLPVHAAAAGLSVQFQILTPDGPPAIADGLAEFGAA